MPISRDHIDLEAGYRVRLPDGCTLRQDESPLELDGATLPAVHAGCEYPGGKVELWIVDTAISDNTDDEILFSFFVPVMSDPNPMFYPLDDYKTYQASLHHNDDTPPGAPYVRRFWHDGLHVGVFGEVVSTEDDGWGGVVSVSARDLDAPHYTPQGAARAIDEAARREGLVRVTASFEGELVDFDKRWPEWERLGSRQMFELRRAEEDVDRITIAYVGDGEDASLALAIAQYENGAVPLDEGERFKLEFVNERVELGDHGDYAYIVFLDGDKSFITFVWVRCGYLAIVAPKQFEAGQTLAEAIDAEIRDNWCTAGT